MNHTTNKTAIDALTHLRNAIDWYTRLPDDTHLNTLRAAIASPAIAALAPTVQDAEPAQGMPQLPMCDASYNNGRFYSEDTMRAYVLADRARQSATPVAQDAAVQGSVDTPEFYQLLQNWYLCHPNTKSVPLYRKIVAHIDAALAQRAAVAEVAGVRYNGEIERNEFGEISVKVPRGVPAYEYITSASAPPAPEGWGAAIDAIADELEEKSNLGIISQFTALCEEFDKRLPSPAPSEPAPQGVPEGWQLVPKEPTPEMVTAMKDAWWKGCSAHCMKTTDAYRVYFAALAATPAPAATSGELDRAKRALIRAGFKDHGAQEWEPPIGPAPHFIEVAATSGGEARPAAVMAGSHAAVKQAADRTDQPGFEVWAKGHGGLPLDPAGDAMSTDDGLHFPTYKFGRTEIAWRAWANRQPAMGSAALAPQSLPAASDASVLSDAQIEKYRIIAKTALSARNTALNDAAALAVRWGDARTDDGGGNALRNCAKAIRALISKDQ